MICMRMMTNNVLLLPVERTDSDSDSDSDSDNCDNSNNNDSDNDDSEDFISDHLRQL